MDPVRRAAIHDAMVRLSDGDREPFAVLVDELWPVILSFVERGVGRGADAEDVAQEVFLKICARTADLDRKRDGLSCAFGIASYEIMTNRRRRQRRREVYDESLVAALPDGTSSHDELLLAGEETLALAHLLEELSTEDRTSVGLDGAPPTMADPTRRKRKQRALDRLRRMWRQVHGEP